MQMGTRSKLSALTSVAPLAAFRFLFGVLMALSLVRFYLNGWIEKLYLEPEFHFTYLGLEWVQPLGGWTYALFALCFIAAIGMALGFRYRWSTLVFFLSFTYIEAMDKTTYLNHYYFISMAALLLLFLPADRGFSLKNSGDAKVPRWMVYAPMLFVGMVYFYAGLAKLNTDWLLHAQPLALWLPGRTDLPILGDFLEQTWVHFAFSWAGALYDLTVPFFLCFRRTRPWAFAAVVGFHILTRLLFPIGMFPFIMVAGASMFFSASLHQFYLGRIFSRFPRRIQIQRRTSEHPLLKPIIVAFLIVQLLLPWRYTLYPGELFWHEQGFRFSWRVMLMEKQGYTNFICVDPATGEQWRVQNDQFLTPFQEKQMAFQPDFILEYAHHLSQHFEQEQHRAHVEVYAQSFVALNGRPSQPFVRADVDLTTRSRGLTPLDWLMPFNDTIYGL